MIRSWFLSRRAHEQIQRDLLLANGTLRRTVARQARDLEGLASECERLREERAFYTLTSSCSDPAAHVRLAQALHRADVELAELQGIDPHCASLGDAS